MFTRQTIFYLYVCLENVLPLYHNMASFLSIWALIFIAKLVICLGEQAVFRKSAQKYLENHVIETRHANTEMECSLYCLKNASCASVNYKISGIEKGLCELNNKTFEQISDYAGTMKDDPEFNHIYIIRKVQRLKRNIIIF